MSFVPGEFLSGTQIHSCHHEARDIGVLSYVLQRSIQIYGFLQYKLKLNPREDHRLAIPDEAGLRRFDGSPFLQFFNRFTATN